VLGCAPADRIEADRAAMAPLPPIDESALGWHNRIRLDGAGPARARR
jgi:hypothetical protein